MRRQSAAGRYRHPTGTQTEDSRREGRSRHVFDFSDHAGDHSRAGVSAARKDARMSRILDKASLVSIGLTFAAILFSADGSGASAHNTSPGTTNPAPMPILPQAVAPESPAPVVEHALAVEPAVAEDADSDLSLSELVAAQGVPGELSRDMHCLAGAIYFEAKSESLEGQYAVGRVVIARAQSGRYPSTYCGVVYQKSQFSFVRGGKMPPINTASRDWREAVAVAELAHADSWDSPVEGAISFHAARVSPGWRLTRMARLGNHVFYR
jgi:N-acetylmuramoyl-L-alanine amidase